MPRLPEFPEVVVDVVGDRSAEPDGFLVLSSLDLALARGGVQGRTFRYDVVTRRALDAAVVVAHFVREGRLHVFLRSSVRPPLALRGSTPTLWELPAGLLEVGESPEVGAARELGEELGVHLPPSAMVPLGPWAAVCPAVIGEMQHYFHVRVDPDARREPEGDGSPLEEAAAVAAVPLEDALAACRAGEVRDAKTELALRRFAETSGSW